MMRVNIFQHLQPADDWQVDVQKHKVDAAALQKINGFPAVLRGRHHIKRRARLPDLLANTSQDRRFVLHHHNADSDKASLLS